MFKKLKDWYEDNKDEQVGNIIILLFLPLIFILLPFFFILEIFGVMRQDKGDAVKHVLFAVLIVILLFILAIYFL